MVQAPTKILTLEKFLEQTETEPSETDTNTDEIDIKDYLRDDDYNSYKTHSDGDGDDDDDREMPIPMGTSLHETLLTQLGFLGLNERQTLIGKQLVGSIEGDGYIRRALESIVNDLAFSQSIETSLNEVEDVLKKIQSFDPAGIAARNLQECLLLQLKRQKDEGKQVDIAIKAIGKYFDEFTKKHYEKIQRGLNLNDEQLREVMQQIIKLNPKPGGNVGEINKAENYVVPDFFIINNGGKLELTLNSRNAPELRISEGYRDMLKEYDRGAKKDKRQKEAVLFIKQKIDAAKWFIDAIKQRQHTLLSTMNAIMEHQYNFFLTGDETELKPMILKDIAEKTSLDISTVSRVANSKFVQTEFGTYRLKFFFSESLSTDSGEEVSTREVKKILSDLIEGEDKKHPLSDERLTELLQEKGYNIARRTVAKYREQLNIPVARLRKEL